MKTYWCSACNQPKKATDFRLNSSRWTGHEQKCRSCSNLDSGRRKSKRRLRRVLRELAEVRT